MFRINKSKILFLAFHIDSAFNYEWKFAYANNFYYFQTIAGFIFCMQLVKPREAMHKSFISHFTEIRITAHKLEMKYGFCQGFCVV